MARAQTNSLTKTRRESAANGRRRKGFASHRRSRKRHASRARGFMEEAVADDIKAMRAEVDDLVAALEQKMERLNRLTRQSASHAAEGANDVVLNAISGLTGQVTDRLQARARSASDDVAKAGNNALRRIVTEIDQRPLLTLAIAAGIGFIAGLVRRPE